MARSANSHTMPECRTGRKSDEHKVINIDTPWRMGGNTRLVTASKSEGKTIESDHGIQLLVTGGMNGEPRGKTECGKGTNKRETRRRGRRRKRMSDKCEKLSE